MRDNVYLVNNSPNDYTYYMPLSDMASGSVGASNDVFASTHWSVELAAAQKGSPAAAEALEGLCRAYWRTLYFYTRRRGYSVEESQDLTQSFFARFLEKKSFALADPYRGRFRTFLLKSLEHFLADDWKRAHRVKRGGGKVEIPWDIYTANNRYAAEFTNTMAPDRLYEKHWAMSLLYRVLRHMRNDYGKAGKSQLFEVLQDFLWGLEDSTSYAQIAERMGMTEGAVRVAVHRLREHYRERLRTEVAQTVSDPKDVDEEIRHLIRAIGKTQ
jgi:RNA polymerase sigma-70 factor (ECF subfamily)